MIKIQTIKQSIVSQGINIAIYGAAGVGKTVLCTTLDPSEPVLFLNVEGGLLSIQDYDGHCVTVRSVQDMEQVYNYLRASDTGYRWIVVDSASEVAEVCLSDLKKQAQGGKAAFAYGGMQEAIMSMIRTFRDLPNYNVIMTFKQEAQRDNSGNMSFGPMFPGNKLGQQVPYIFDEVMALCVSQDENGVSQRWLVTNRDQYYDGKDRSDRLLQYELLNPGNTHLAYIVAKIRGQIDPDSTYLQFPGCYHGEQTGMPSVLNKTSETKPF